MLNIAVITSTTRQGRFADKVIPWFMALAGKSTDMKLEVVDLREFPLPFFDEPASNAWLPSKSPVAQQWQKKIASYDGYIFLVAEYNRSIPAALKNALDYAYPEWLKKPAGYVGYGGVGAARAIEHLRLICVELQMVPMRAGVHIQGADFMAAFRQGKALETLTYLDAGVKEMLSQLKWWASVLKPAREASASSAT